MVLGLTLLGFTIGEVWYGYASLHGYSRPTNLFDAL